MELCHSIILARCLLWYLADDYGNDYLTDVITRKALQFLDRHSEVAASSQKHSFLMVLSPPAPHAPFTPAPQHSQEFANASAPRMPTFNYLGDDLERQKHWLLRQDPKPLPSWLLDKVNSEYTHSKQVWTKWYLSYFAVIVSIHWVSQTHCFYHNFMLRLLL